MHSSVFAGLFDGKEPVVSREHKVLSFLWLATLVVLLQSALLVDSTGSDGTNLWALICSSVGLGASSMLLLVAQIRPPLLGGKLRWFEFTLFLWWVAGAVVLTFYSPYHLAGNGYFGTWAALWSSWNLVAMQFDPCKRVHEAVLHPWGALLFSSAVFAIQSIAVREDSDAEAWRWSQDSSQTGQESRGNWKVHWALACGLVSSALSVCHLVLSNVIPDALPTTWFQKFAPVLLVAWWSMGILITTFAYPYMYACNGYFACWASWAASAVLLSRFRWAGRWKEHAANLIQRFGLPIELFAVLFFSCIVLMAGAALCDKQSCTAYNVWAMTCAAISFVITVVVLVSRGRGIVKDLAMARWAVFLWILWVAGVSCTTLKLPFRLLSNGFVGAWMSLLYTMLLIRRNAFSLGVQSKLDALETLVKAEPESAILASASFLLLFQAAIDSGANSLYEAGMGWGVLCGCVSLLVFGFAAACHHLGWPRRLRRSCVFFLAVWWLLGVARLTFYEPYLLVDTAYLSCWLGFSTAGLLLHKEWQAYMDSQVQGFRGGTPVVPTVVQVVTPPGNQNPEPTESARASDFIERSRTFEHRGWGLKLVDDDDELNSLRRLFRVTDPRSLGRGRDVRVKDKYTDLVLVHAWRVHAPEKHEVYSIKKRSVNIEVKMMEEAGIEMPVVRTKLDEAADSLLDLDATVNEKLLLHGTKPEHALSILHNGLSEKLSGGLFGKGVYLAEDPSKIDQYCTPDEKQGEGDDLVIQLQAALYQCGAVHAGNLFYCFVARAVLGLPMSTTDGANNASEPYQPIFATSDQRELAQIPGSSPPMHYHALIAEAGPGYRVERHREFIIFEGDRIALEYVLAFHRK